MTVGPGNRWADVYSKLDALGIAIGGGRVATVGVGGLTLGGIIDSAFLLQECCTFLNDLTIGLDFLRRR